MEIYINYIMLTQIGIISQLWDYLRATTIMGRVAAHIHRQTQDLPYLGSAFTWHDRRYARAQMNRGGADSCAFGRGGAESTTFDLKIADRRQIPNRVIHVF